MSLNECTDEYISQIKCLVSSYIHTNGTKLMRENCTIYTVNQVVHMFNGVDTEDKNNGINHKSRELILSDSTKKWSLIGGKKYF